MIYAFPKIDQFLYFVKERHAIWTRRNVRHQREPWTRDEILRAYKFTNVYRELDRVTVWIGQHWREPNKKRKDLWFAMVIARLINHPEILAELGFPKRWDKRHFLDVMHRRKREGLQCFGGAYIVSTGGRAMEKADYLAKFVLDPLWDGRGSIRPRDGDTLAQFHSRLMQYDGMGSFMAAQIVADMKYTPVLKKAKDWMTFASSGPGSRRGMNYVMGLSRKNRWREHEWRDALAELHALVQPHFEHWNYPRIHAQDLQNCLCEFSKYSRTVAGTGRPKTKFKPYEGGD